MATQQTDFYETLGVARTASADDIKRAFRRLAMEFHPDRNQQPGAEARFKAINEAYEVLSDPDKRAAYDRFGIAGLNGMGERGFEGFGNFGGFGDIFDAFFGGTATRNRRTAQRGRDLHDEVTISFEQAAVGTETEIEIARLENCAICGGRGSEPGSQPDKCPACNGAGEVRRVQQSIFGQFVNVATCERCRGEGRIVTRPCTSCRGSGRERKQRKLVIKIPPGVDSGSQMRLSGEGEAGLNGGGPGNLYITIDVQAHAFFQREGDDLIYDLPLNYVQAALGDEVEIPSLEGRMALKIPAGTQSGRVFQLREKGMPHLRGGGRGDELVRVRVITPTTLTKEQRKLFEQLGGSLGKAVIPQEDKGIFGRIRDEFKEKLS
ncbi:MAG TPA: molecular chaperone DnaJ [Dehalococcoidia bacterium]|nr:molecular chaperone DnaJ [Dehalococcoidia bacterium]